MSKPGKVLKGLCKKLGVRLTVKRGKKRVYKSVAVLKAQCKRKKKKKKKVKRKVKRRRRFGTGGLVGPIRTLPLGYYKAKYDSKTGKQYCTPCKKNPKATFDDCRFNSISQCIEFVTTPHSVENPQALYNKVMTLANDSPTSTDNPLRRLILENMGEMNKNIALDKTEKNIKLIIKREKQSFQGISLKGLMVNTTETGELGLRQYHQRPRDKELKQKKYFDKLHLKKANFNMSKMWRVTFMKSILEQATFVESFIHKCDFSDSNLKKVDFTNAEAEGNIYSWCDMKEANFTNASIKNSNFGSSDLRGANFGSSDLRGANFYGCDLRGANFTEAVFKKGILDAKPKFYKAIYDNKTIFPNGFIPSEYGAIHVDDWINQVKLKYSAIKCGGDALSILSFWNTWRENEKIRHQIKLHERKVNDEIQKFSNGKIDLFTKFNLIRNLDIFCRDFNDQIYWIRGRSKEIEKQIAAIKIQALFKNNKKAKKAEEEAERQARMPANLRKELSKQERQEALYQRIGLGVGLVGVGGLGYLTHKLIKEQRKKKKKRKFGKKKKRKKVKKSKKKLKRKK